MQATFSGVRNLDNKKPRVWAHDGKPYSFEPGEVKILPSDVANFLAGRIEVSHEMKDGKFVGVPTGHYVFELVPLHEALKVAKLEENPSVVEAKRKADAEAAERAKIVEAVKADLAAQGWQPPKHKATNKES